MRFEQCDLDAGRKVVKEGRGFLLAMAVLSVGKLRTARVYEVNVLGEGVNDAGDVPPAEVRINFLNDLGEVGHGVYSFF